jgi:protein-S-isoprenylcysteine O-methyltransferase Ste14
MSRLFVFGYGLTAYSIFFVTYLYAAGFVGNLVVPKSLDSTPTAPFGTALLINLGLLGLFAVQHSVMARPWFKRILLRVVPHAAERSTYVLASSLALILLFWQWSPLGGVVWDIQNQTGRALMYAAFAFGWLLVLVTTFLINHFDLFGLRQVWLYFRGREYRSLHFVTPGPYRLVRHPLYLGWLFAFWATPTMTVTHLLFAVMTTCYILAAIQFEEHDLVNAHPEYAEYQRRVPMIVPIPTRRAAHAVEYPLIGLLALMSVWPIRALAQHDPTHTLTSQPHEPTASQKKQAGAFVELVRESTERFRDVRVAEAEGYGLLFGCVSGPDLGAMGLHYVNFPLVMDGELDATRPEIVIYEAMPNGDLKITGADYLVLADAWDAKHPGAPPQLMGQLFHLFESPNRFGLPAFYTLHVWAWKDNPNGTFVNWHPNVSCDGFSAQNP